MSGEKQRKVHGSGGAYVGGDWVDIEDCQEKFLNPAHPRQQCAACPRSRTRHSANRADGSYDVVVIGAGCIGGAIARELSKSTASVLLLEAADDVTQGATKGNSGIVHAGYDDTPGSVRAKFCWPGNQMFPQLDKEMKFGYQKTGSLVLARGAEEEKHLEELLERGHKNGVKNLRIVDQQELRRMEPFVNTDCTAGLHSPDAGTLTPYEFAIALCENAADNGVEVRIRREVTAIQKNPEDKDKGFVLTVQHWEPKEATQYLYGATSDAAVPLMAAAAIIVPIAALALQHAKTSTPAGAAMMAVGALFAALTFAAVRHFRRPATEKHEYSPSPGTVFQGESVTETIRADYVVNAAGCSSDKVAAMLGDKSFKIKPRMGEYLLLHKDEGYKANAILFPCPHPVLGKGVLVQTTLWGNLILGPTARDTLVKNEQTGEYEVDPNVRDEDRDSIFEYILTRCKQLVPSFDAGQVIHTFAGARAKSTVGDWIIAPVPSAPGAIHAAGIDSPGIAASPAIAVEVVRLLVEAGAPVGVSHPDPTFNPHRKPLIVPKDGLKANGKPLKYGPNSDPWKHKAVPDQNIVCKCEKVTEAEVIEACRRSLPVDSTQAIRRRTRAGMGYCQGDPKNYNCEERIATIIARETGQRLDQVSRRPWPASSMMKERWFGDDEKSHLRELAAKCPS